MIKKSIEDYAKEKEIDIKLKLNDSLGVLTGNILSERMGFELGLMIEKGIKTEVYVKAYNNKYSFFWRPLNGLVEEIAKRYETKKMIYNLGQGSIPLCSRGGIEQDYSNAKFSLQMEGINFPKGFSDIIIGGKNLK